LDIQSEQQPIKQIISSASTMHKAGWKLLHS